jgi:staphylococcal nuclease domain-containing protein 1
VLHPAGNVAEHLVANGLARIVDWHAGMLSSLPGAMEKLRAAEKNAKERRLCLFANAAVPKSNGVAGAGSDAHKAFDGIVTRVWSGELLSVAEKDSGKERKLYLSSVRAPKYVSCSWCQLWFLIIITQTSRS